ncbi:MAG: RluA family pseudouridine synthase [Clostridia bacterium]|nr:RluA family pseudouridine synthase [Clostridia bacterium]
MQFKIPEIDGGISILQFIKQNLHISSKMLKYLKYRPDGICVNGQRQTVRYLLKGGNELTLAMEDTDRDTSDLTPVDLPLEILYEDEDLVVPSKPADMPTHPSCDHHLDTVANALAFRYASMGKPFVFRPVNRLDRNTRGLLLIARNKMAAGRLSLSMKEGLIQKTYLAVLDGELATNEGVIDACLHRTAQSIILREVCPPDAPDADPALTEYRVLARDNGRTLVKARPITGRTHQLRVHFASLGHPITGDDLYGNPSSDIPRHALHAHTLCFPHPSTGETLCLTAPLPTDLLNLIRSCFPSISLNDFS